MEFELEELVLEVGQARFGGDLGVADSAGLDNVMLVVQIPVLEGTKTYRAAGDLVCLAVDVLVVLGLAITVHGHDVWEHGARAVVLVCVNEDTEALEVVGVTKDGSWLRALLGEPHGEAVAVEIALAMDLEFDRNLLA